MSFSVSRVSVYSSAAARGEVVVAVRSKRVPRYDWLHDCWLATRYSLLLLYGRSGAIGAAALMTYHESGSELGIQGRHYVCLLILH